MVIVSPFATLRSSLDTLGLSLQSAVADSNKFVSEFTVIGGLKLKQVDRRLGLKD